MKIKVQNEAKFYVHNGKIYPVINGEVEIPDEHSDDKEEKKKK